MNLNNNNQLYNNKVISLIPNNRSLIRDNLFPNRDNSKKMVRIKVIKSLC
jgi:hypothetical protein